MEDKLVMIAHGTPGKGFTLIGPVLTNSEEAEDITDRLLCDSYWWYLDFTPAAEYIASRELPAVEARR